MKNVNVDKSNMNQAINKNTDQVIRWTTSCYYILWNFRFDISFPLVCAPKMLQENTNFAPKMEPNIESTWNPEAPKWSQHDGKMLKNIEKTSPTKNGHVLVSIAVFWMKKWPTWPHLSSKSEANMNKTSIQKWFFFLISLGIDLWADLGGFSVPKYI